MKLKIYILLLFCYLNINANVNKRSKAAVSALVGPRCPALLSCIDVDVPIVVLLGK